MLHFKDAGGALLGFSATSSSQLGSNVDIIFHCIANRAFWVSYQTPWQAYRSISCQRQYCTTRQWLGRLCSFEVASRASTEAALGPSVADKGGWYLQSYCRSMVRFNALPSRTNFVHAFLAKSPGSLQHGLQVARTSHLWLGTR